MDEQQADQQSPRQADREPETARARLIRSQTSPRRWGRLVEEAVRRAEIMEGVKKLKEETGGTWVWCVGQVAPEVEWPNYAAWKRAEAGREGPLWERLPDGRLPPAPEPIPEAIRVAACLLRRANRSINTEQARVHLKAQYGEQVKVSEASLRRIWAGAGLSYEPAEGASGQKPGEQVEQYGGGGGLALLGAAEVELGTSQVLAQAVREAGGAVAASQAGIGQAEAEPEGSRNERGQFPGQYNEWKRRGVEPGQADGRWRSDQAKRQERELGELTTLQVRPELLGAKLLCLGVMPLLTERRGLVGLEGPAGRWLEVLGVPAYMPRTPDKQLAESGLLGVDEALWGAHAGQWQKQAVRWVESGPQWRCYAVYVDATTDPYRTSRYALSGKVSRVGRVMPCLSRAAVTSGPGVPLVMQTRAGTVSLKKELIGLLRQVEGWVGEGELGRLTIIDAEMATVGLLRSLHQELDRGFITVLKGAALRGAERRDEEPWQPYRQRDEVRESEVVLRGPGAPEGGFAMRGVEMRRTSGRHPHSTLFLCNWDREEISTVEVPDAYLSRWPIREQCFRNGRHGGGPERSHGYGGQLVTHLALPTKVEQARRKPDRAQARQAQARRRHESLATAEPGGRRPSAEQSALRQAARAELRRADQAVAKCTRKLAESEQMPREIYARDPTRDNVMTCLKLNVLLLLQFVLKEYFGDLGMEWRSFIEQFVLLPVTVRTSRRRVVYQIQANSRQPQRMAQLRSACAEVNRRQLHRAERLLRFEVVDPPPAGAFPVIGAS